MNRIFRFSKARYGLLWSQPPSSLLKPQRAFPFPKSASTAAAPLPPAAPARSTLWYARLGTLLLAHGLLWNFLGGYIVDMTIPFAKGLKSSTLMSESSDTSIFERAADNNKTVKELRANPAYAEVRPWSSLAEEQRKTKLTAGLLAGNGLIQYNRIWVNGRDGSTVLVLGLGRRLAGYPETIHGGLIATIIDEALGRTALNVLPTRNVVTAKLTLTYKRPTPAQRPSELLPTPNEFIVLRTWVVERTDRKATVQARLEDSEGRTLVESDAIFVVPRGWKLDELPKRV
ncbi:hypothetical protein L873DRAFT_1675164 [Choiromyces venosus 120613-1]|uniref:Thioesterase domain-containing protein n=1 Tax=Choiromyces venosus 120613-1 TaxID=1336337 RepID=A0A3N4JU16_9PEZI|nr:hypothetical protein L873DRAFT_1675164 [Choiromyces venosus 120613-1]